MIPQYILDQSAVRLVVLFCFISFLVLSIILIAAVLRILLGWCWNKPTNIQEQADASGRSTMSVSFFISFFQIGDGFISSFKSFFVFSSHLNIAVGTYQYMATPVAKKPHSSGGVVYQTSFLHVVASDCGCAGGGGDRPAVTSLSGPARVPVIRPANGTVLRCLLCAGCDQSPAPTHLSAS
jgi:hypothetical protein